MRQVDLMGFKGLVLASVLVLTVVAGCEQEVLQSCGNRQEVCVTYCKFIYDSILINNPDCPTNCLTSMKDLPISWLKTCVDNGDVTVTYTDPDRTDCIAAERVKSYWACSGPATVAACTDGKCCVVNECADYCGPDATSALCEIDQDGQAGCVCTIP